MSGGDGEPAPTSNAESRAAVSFGEALRFWLKLGFISFGGPAGQVAILHSELVERRRWVSEGRFLHALNYCMLLPGPEAQQLATYMGWLLHGTLGGVAAGALFILPSVFVLGALSAVYVAYGQTPAVAGILWGVRPAVVAIVAAAVVRIANRSIRTPFALALAAAAFVAMYLFVVPFPLVILAAALTGAAAARFRPRWLPLTAHAGEGAQASLDAGPADHHARHRGSADSRWIRLLLAAAVLWLVPMGALRFMYGENGVLFAMGRFFTQAALVTFGGAYAVLPYVAQHAVDVAGWLRPGQMIDGLALGESTPGPLIMVVAFVGFVGAYQSGLGWSGAVLGLLTATYFTFLPSFFFILIGAPHVESLRRRPLLAGVLGAITAAVVGVVLVLAFLFGGSVFVPAPGQVDVRAIVLAAASLFLLLRFKANVAAIVAMGALAGLASQLLAA